MSTALKTLSGEPLEDRGIILAPGKRYLTRNGMIVLVKWIIQGIGSSNKSYLDHPAFCESTNPKTGRTVDTSYAINGKWCIYKERLKNTAPDYDIVGGLPA